MTRKVTSQPFANTQLKNIVALFIVCTGITSVCYATGNAVAQVKIEKSFDVAKVVSEFPVGFCLLTAGKLQFVAYYNEDRNMTVAARELGSDQWQYQTLPSKIEWDSHNYITMAVDQNRQLHVSGNMHRDKLVYFRTEMAGDIKTLTRLPMTGNLEDRVTYPKFLNDHRGQLLFSYRDGGSGNGMRIYNKYNHTKRTWSRFLDTPLLHGEGKRNAYPSVPVRGPDGWFHMIWVWRDTPDCATCNHLSYARSRDLVRWRSAFGRRVELPLKLSHEEFCVDPIPSGGGIINGGAMLSFDSEKRPVISYHKHDAGGNMQIYAARPGRNDWALHQLTNWTKPVNFGGNGSMGFIGISVSSLDQVEPGILAMKYRHRDYGRGRLVVDEQTFKPLTREIAVPRTIPKELDELQSDFEGLQIKRSQDIGDSGAEAVRYLLQWETLTANHDRPRQPPLPQPSVLKLYKITSH